MTESSLTEQCQLYPTLCGTSRCQAADRVRREFTKFHTGRPTPSTSWRGGLSERSPPGNPCLAELPTSCLLLDLVDGGGHDLPVHTVMDNRFDLSTAQPCVF